MMIFDQQNGQKEVQEPSLVQGGISSKLILVIEDNEVNASVILQVLAQESPYRLAHATNGLAAWKFLQHIKPQLIILDYRLPDLNGIELYDRIHNSEGLHSIPVLMISAALPYKEIEKRGIAGLSKPFDLDELLDIIDTFLA